MAEMAITVFEGDYVLMAGPKENRGKYKFKAETSQVCDLADESKVFGTFCYGPVSPESSLTFPKGDAVDKCMRIVDSEIIAEIQKPQNSAAYFCLPSQFNGAEYPSERSIIREIEQYKFDNTGGPRGQLAVHPAAGQFVLHNASSTDKPEGINAIDIILARTAEAWKDEPGSGFQLVNGYLSVPKRTNSTQQAKALQVLAEHAHTLRPLVMKGVPACGVTPNKRAFSKECHRVNLVYASAVPVQSYMNRADSSETPFQAAVAELLATVQYYGALKSAAIDAQSGALAEMKRDPFVETAKAADAVPEAADRGGASFPGSDKAKVFLMPLGGGVFNNPWTSIAKSMSTAVEMLTDEEKSLLDICVLTWNGNSTERETMNELLARHGKLREESGGGASFPGAGDSRAGGAVI